MNPAMMNYWLSQLQEPTREIGLGNPQMAPMNIPEMQSAPQEQQMPMAPDSSPISRGAASGLEAARQSLALSDEQRNRSLGHGLMAFSANMNRPKHGPGIEGTLGAINEALNPALQAYVARQDAEREMNAKSLDRQDSLERQARQDELAERRYQQTEALRRDQMRETKAYRDAMLGLRQQQMDAKKGADVPQYTEEGFDLSRFAPIEDKKMLNLYNKDKQGTAKVLSQLNEIEEMDKEYQKLTKGSSVDPSNPYIGKYVNKAKDAIGYMGHKQLRDETILRQRINSKIESFTIQAERAMKGGVLGPGIIDRFKEMGIFPTLGEPPDIRTAKIKDLKKELNTLRDAANTSIKYKRQIDPVDYEEMQSLFKGKDEPANDLSSKSDAELTKEYEEALHGGR